MPITPGGKPKKYKFTAGDVARAKGVTVSAVKKAVGRGILNLGDIESVCKYIGCRKNHGIQ